VESKAGKKMNYYRQRDSERVIDSIAVSACIGLCLFMLIAGLIWGAK